MGTSEQEIVLAETKPAEAVAEEPKTEAPAQPEPTPVQEVAPQPAQFDMFGPKGAVAKFEKKLAQNKKPTAADSMRAMAETRDVVGRIVNDIRQIATYVEAHDNGLGHIFEAFNCLLDLLITKNLITKEEFQANWQEKVVKPRQEALEKQKQEIIAKMKKESAEAASKQQVTEEPRAMPDCKYCGKPDCIFCATLAKQQEEAKIESPAPAPAPVDECCAGCNDEEEFCSGEGCDCEGCVEERTKE